MSIEPAPKTQVSSIQADRLIAAIHAQTAATLAAAIIAARGKPISVKDALEITHTVQLSIQPPPPGTGIGAQWAKDKDAKQAKVWE